MNISQEIMDLCIFKDLDDAIEHLENFGTLNFVDEKIQDGIDDDSEDNYLMMRSFDFIIGSHSYYICLFYGDSTRIIGSVGIYSQ